MKPPALAATIRPERPEDVGAIAEITRDAFCDRTYSSGTEQFIIDALRRNGALTISLLAELNFAVVGHIAFSPVQIAVGSKDWYGLGPVAVKPELQRQGIGSTLVRDGLAALKDLGAQGCVLVGDRVFYGRFGFKHDERLTLEGVPQEFFLAITFGEALLSGRVTYHPAFEAQG